MGNERCLVQRDFSLNRTGLLVIDFSVEFSGSGAPCVPLDARFLLSSPVPQAQGPYFISNPMAVVPPRPGEHQACVSSGFCGSLGSGAVPCRGKGVCGLVGRPPMGLLRAALELLAGACLLCSGCVALRHLAKPAINCAHL